MVLGDVRVGERWVIGTKDFSAISCESKLVKNQTFFKKVIKLAESEAGFIDFIFRVT